MLLWLVYTLIVWLLRLLVSGLPVHRIHPSTLANLLERVLVSPRKDSIDQDLVSKAELAAPFYSCFVISLIFCLDIFLCTSTF